MNSLVTGCLHLETLANARRVCDGAGSADDRSVDSKMTSYLVIVTPCKLITR